MGGKKEDKQKTDVKLLV